MENLNIGQFEDYYLNNKTRTDVTWLKWHFNLLIKNNYSWASIVLKKWWNILSRTAAGTHLDVWRPILQNEDGSWLGVRLAAATIHGLLKDWYKLAQHLCAELKSEVFIDVFFHEATAHIHSLIKKPLVHNDNIKLLFLVYVSEMSHCSCSYCRLLSYIIEYK